MRTGIPLTIALVVSLLVSGCLGGDKAPPVVEEPPVVAPPPGPTVLAWGLSDCRIVIAMVPVAASALAPDTPPGFTPLTPEQFGLPADPRGDAVLGMETFTCESGIGLNGTVTMYGSFFWPVAPDEANDQGTDLHFVKRDVLMVDEGSRLALVEAGVPARSGSTFVSQTPISQWHETPAGIVADVGLTFENGEGFRVRASAATPLEGMDDFTFAEVTKARDGLVVWWAHVKTDAVFAGAGFLTLTGEGFAKEIVGETNVPAYTMVATGSFEAANVTIPAPGNATA